MALAARWLLNTAVAASPLGTHIRMYSPKAVRVQTLSNVIISIRIHKEEKLTTAGGGFNCTQTWFRCPLFFYWHILRGIIHSSLQVEIWDGRAIQGPRRTVKQIIYECCCAGLWIWSMLYFLRASCWGGRVKTTLSWWRNRAPGADSLSDGALQLCCLFFQVMTLQTEVSERDNIVFGGDYENQIQ